MAKNLPPALVFLRHHCSEIEMRDGGTGVHWCLSSRDGGKMSVGVFP